MMPVVVDMVIDREVVATVGPSAAVVPVMGSVMACVEYTANFLAVVGVASIGSAVMDVLAALVANVAPIDMSVESV
jgi:hypothetical protein